MLSPLLGLEIADLEALLADERKYRARQLYEALYRQRISSLGAATALPEELRQRLGAAYCVGLPEQAACFESVDGTRRYLLRLADLRTVETVWMPEEDRDTACISTQVGCAVDCRFCLTARLGLERNLTAGELVGQVLHVGPSERLNIVMMGQGEPLLNLTQVLKATRLLTDPTGLAISPRRVTLSTSGIIPGIEGLAREPVRPKLAISLNASTEEQRCELMPITRKYHLADLIETCRRYPLRSWERLTFEYVLLKGVNDSDADARRVVRLLAHLKCKVNLIALNPGPGIPFETPDPERVLAFQTILKKSFPCFLRTPRGLDVYAACGQLKKMGEPLPPILPTVS